MSFINDNFMLKNEPAKKLYAMVKDLPIIDYHCHLQPKQIAENYQFRNAFDLFLGGDHYKWRQMRTAGVPEELVTGNADEYAKFKEFAKTLPKLIGNPLYHWTHLELKRYFDIDEALNEESCERIWNKCNELLAKPEFRAQELIKRSNVEVICTTGFVYNNESLFKQDVYVVIILHCFCYFGVIYCASSSTIVRNVS